MEVSYIVVSEETARSSSKRFLLINPFVKKVIKLPCKMKFCVSMGLVFENSDITSLHMYVNDPNDELVGDSDILKLHFNSDDLVKDGKRTEMTVGAEITMNSTSEASFVTPGVYKVSLYANKELVAESFFILEEHTGDDDE